MLTKVTKNDLIALIKKEHPSWDENYISNIAEEHVRNLDSRLDEPLYSYIKTGEKAEFKNGEFSLYIIGRLIRGISYLDAVVYMDGYLKDPVQGRIDILRR